MNPSALLRALRAAAFVLCSLFHADPVLADVCSAPGFAAALAFRVGKNPVSVAVGDFDNDGKPDLTVANSAGVSVLLGRGMGPSKLPSLMAPGPIRIPWR